MQKSQQSQSVGKQEQKTVEGLAKYLKKQKTYTIQYEIVREMVKIMQNPKPDSYNDDFKSLYNNISKEMKKTLLFSTLNYQIWNNENLSVEIRQKTEFFKIVSDWIEIYQLKVGDLKKLQHQIEFIYQFFLKNTNYLFEKVVLIDEIHEDLVELLGRQFWGLPKIDQQHQSADEGDEGEEEKQKQATKQEAAQFLKLLQNLVNYYAFYENNQSECWYNCELYILKQKTKQYKQFIFRSLEYILSVNNGKKSADKHLQKHQQMELTRLALIFLQRPDIDPQQSIKLLKLLMLRTSKIVRYAMVVDYVRLYEYYQKSNQQRIIQQLQNMVYFRQLIIGQNQIGEAGLMNTHLGKSLQIINIPARSKHRILLSHEPNFGRCSILQLQVLIQGGDISIGMYTIKNGKQTEYWKQDRTQDRRVDILLKQQGLYIIQFNNTYSWVKGKKISFKTQQFCIGT